jgi:hypothetical protein
VELYYKSKNVNVISLQTLTGKNSIKTQDLDHITGMLEKSIYDIEKNEFAFWLRKARNHNLQLKEIYEGYEVSI